MKFKYEKSAERWLEENGFDEPERTRLLELLNKLERDMIENKKGPLITLPKNTPDKIAAMVALLDAVDDEKGCPACFTDQNTIAITPEARALYSEGMGIQEDERTLKMADKAKEGRGQMDPRRRGNARS
jgi:hypothetical protein